MPNFMACGAEFYKCHNTTCTEYVYHGPVYGQLSKDLRPIITNAGCKRLCGTGVEYYPWSIASATITTWVLPVLGLLVQLPFESNAFWGTLWSLARWCGSPIASLSYVLWNIKVTGKCALMSDMATGLDEYGDEDSAFANTRDALFILSVMNQYSVKRRMPAREGEKLFRIALLSHALLVQPTDGVPQSLVHRRKLLARTLRERRKKGIVPVYFSLSWFIFALSLSIADAFGQLGDDQTAHDLAIGLLLAWLPVFVIATIVDRNPIGSDPIRRKLNEFVEDVRQALLRPATRKAYLAHYGRREDDLAWTGLLEVDEFYHDGVFAHFAGQGRVRWHYGIAHSITAGMETAYIAARGRDWLQAGSEAESTMIWAPVKDQGLFWFDFRMIWQMVGSIVVVGGTLFGAFILSYFTPTVGLGCRSGGYLVYFVLALANFLIEMIIWWLIPEATDNQQWIQRRRTRSSISGITTHISQRLDRVDSNKWKWITTARFLSRRVLRKWKGMTLRDRIGATVLRLLDVSAATWLAFLACAQIFGADRNCDCFTSIWGSGGGYLDFNTIQHYGGHNVAYYWSFGMALSLVVMMLSIIFITYEYCTQSHLSSEYYDQAMQGLRMTRSVKRHMIWCYQIPASIISMVRVLLNSILDGKVSPRRNSLVWTPIRINAAPTNLGPMPGPLRTPERSSGQARSRAVSSDHLLPLASLAPEGSSHSRSSSEAAV